MAKKVKALNKKKGQGAKEVEHWKMQQNMLYYFYLVENVHSFIQDKRKNFKVMEEFLQYGSPTCKKTAEQCRSHHQKQIEKYAYSVKEMLKNFYQNYYTIRRVGLQHCYMEFQEELRQKGIPVNAQRLQAFKDNWKLILDEPPTIMNHWDAPLTPLIDESRNIFDSTTH